MINSNSIPRLSTQRAILISITLGVMLIPLNSSMIAVALPEIMREFGASVDAAGWLVTAYLITMALFQLIAGKLGDQFGRRKFLIGALIYFGLASLFAAFAPSLPMLIFLRVQQAMAGAIIATNGIALAFQIVPADQRGKNLGWVNAAVVLAAAGGPPLGGLLVGVAGWQTIFWINIPPAILALILGWQFIPNDSPHALTSRPSKSSPRLHLIHRQTFVSANAAIVLSNLAMYATLLVIPILLSKRAGWTSLQTGMILAAMSVTMALCSPLGGRWADRLGRRLPVVLGLAIVSVALVPLAWLGTEIAIAILIGCLACAGIGLGLSASALQTSALESVAPEQTGVASGIASTSRYLGSIIGSGLLTMILGSTPAENFQTIFLIGVIAGLGATLCGLGIRNVAPQKAN